MRDDLLYNLIVRFFQRFFFRPQLIFLRFVFLVFRLYSVKVFFRRLLDPLSDFFIGDRFRLYVIPADSAAVNDQKSVRVAVKMIVAAAVKSRTVLDLTEFGVA